MASTGVSWMPLFALLAARGVQGLRSDPRQAKRVPGRPQTARLDCPWLPRLHADGLLAGAVRPAHQGGVLRGYVRHRQRLLPDAAHPMPQRHKAFEQMHRTLPQVVRAITGVTGRAILQAILAGARAPPRLAQRRHPPCHHTADDSATALQGTWRAAPLLA
jgi:transposase